MTQTDDETITGRPCRHPLASSVTCLGALTLSLWLAGCSDASLGGGMTGEDEGSGGSVLSGDGDGAGGLVGDGDGDTSSPGTLDSGIELDGNPQFHSIVRLTHLQWENSIAEIFSVTDVSELTSTLHPDPPNGKFSNNEKSLFVGEELWADYQRVAEELAEGIASNATVLNRFGGVSDPGAFIENVTRRAFRRELTDAERSKYEELWGQGATFFSSGNDARDGARVFLEAVLQSPLFLYRTELSAAHAERLSGVELATKLSLLLENRLPDDALLADAEGGRLDTDEGLLEVAEELLEGEIALSVLTNFHAELYGLDRYRTIEKSPRTFPNYDPTLNDVLLQADLSFFSHIVDSDGGFRGILTSPVAFVNDRIAGFYGESASGGELQETTLGPERPGYLTRLGFLTYNATLSQSDPIHRGVDINNKFLCADLAPPQGTIPPLPEPEPNQTNRERVTAHTGEGGCANCHLKIINPPGFAFENFDAVGQTRTMDNGNAVDTADTYLFNDGEKSFAGAPELIEIMAEHPQTHGCYGANLTEFVLGRDLSGSDVPLVTQLQTLSLDDDAPIKALVLSMVQDPKFSTARGNY